MMVKRAAVVVGRASGLFAVLVCLALAPAAFGQRVGVGGSFMGGPPMFDAFGEVSLGGNFWLRGTFSYIASFRNMTAFAAEGSFLWFLGAGAFQPYLGGGGGAVMMTGEGGIAGGFVVSALAGAYFPLNPWAGAYLGVRFLGQVGFGAFGGLFGPSVGLYVTF